MSEPNSSANLASGYELAVRCMIDKLGEYAQLPANRDQGLGRARVAIAYSMVVGREDGQAPRKKLDILVGAEDGRRIKRELQNLGEKRLEQRLDNLAFLPEHDGEAIEIDVVPLWQCAYVPSAATALADIGQRGSFPYVANMDLLAFAVYRYGLRIYKEAKRADIDMIVETLNLRELAVRETGKLLRLTAAQEDAVRDGLPDLLTGLESKPEGRRLLQRLLAACVPTRKGQPAHDSGSHASG